MVGLDDYFRLKKPLYGICDSGDCWGATLTEHIHEYLQMEPLTGDPSLYVKKRNGNTICMLGGYVNGCLFAGNEEFKKYIRNMKRKFDAKPIEWGNVQFLGVHIHTKRKTISFGSR